MIKISNLNKKNNEFRLKCEEDLTFKSKNMYFIKGKSGSGKTTLLYILGLISSLKGYTYHYYNHKISTQKQKDLIKKNEIGFIYQNFNVIETMTLFENLQLFAHLNGNKMTRKKAKKIFEMLRLSIPLNQNARTLSGGEKQRFCLACILAKNPHVIIADEPTSALDKESSDILMNVLYELAHQHGKIVIVSTHTSQYDGLADSIYSIKEGKIYTTRNEVNNSTSKRKVKDRKISFDFFRKFSKHYLHEIYHNYSLIFIMSIIIFSLSVFLVRFGEVSQQEYIASLNDCVKNELIVDTNLVNNKEIQDFISEIKELKGVENIYKISFKVGDIETKSGKQGNVNIYPLYPFQVEAYNENIIYGDTSFVNYVGEEVKVNIDGKEHTMILKNVFGINRTSLFGDGTSIFIPEQSFNFKDAFFNGKFLIELNDFRQMDFIKSYIENMDSSYEVTSLFKKISTLVNNAELNRIYESICFVIMNIITLLLMSYISYHEYVNKKKELCIYQANGLSKGDIIKLELTELVLKVIIYLFISTILLVLMSYVANKIIFDMATLKFDFIFMKWLCLLSIVDVCLPELVFIIKMKNSNVEDQLRAN